MTIKIINRLSDLEPKMSLDGSLYMINKKGQNELLEMCAESRMLRQSNFQEKPSLVANMINNKITCGM